MSSDRILDSLKKQCARREFCSWDVLERLRRYGITGGEAAMALAELQNGKWVDDVRYAECFAREKAAVAGWGITKIRYCLGLKKIPPQVVEGALREIDAERAEKRKRDVLEIKWREIYRGEEDGMMRKMKMMRFALGRGYSADDVYEIINFN